MGKRLRVSTASRRDFLKTGASTLGALTLAPLFIPSRAFGANDRITTAIIGIGGPAAGGAPNTQLVAVCDVREDKLAGHRANKEISVYRDFREVLAREDIDAVLIGTPDHWHALLAIKAAEAGKDVYCEKPLSLTIREARAMVNAARKHAVVFQTGSQQRSDYGGKFRFACEMARNRRIGEIKSIHCNVGGPSGPCDEPVQPTPSDVDWDMWLGPAPWRPYHEKILRGWRAYQDYSGGGMTDWGAHHFDIAQWALDMDHSGPVQIIPPGADAELLTYVYANGVKVYHGGGGGAGVVIRGTEGTILVDRDKLETQPESIMREPTGPNELHLYRSPGHKEDWVECIRTRSRPICDVEIGCRSVSVCHLGNIAYQLKRPIQWDPSKEEILGDEEASRMLDRPKRSPWTI